jgi:DNA-binding FadR family transcriptional regulator
VNTFFRPVRPGNAFEDTVERLLQTIRLGVVLPGERLPSERELALLLSVSRDTVREAIRVLADSGYVESRRGRYGGTFVVGELPPAEQPVGRAGADEVAQPPLTAEEIEDVLAMRQILEIGAVRLVAERTLSASERDTVWSALRELEECAPEEYRILDSRLHLAIAGLVPGTSLVPLVAENRMHINRFLDGIPVLERNIAHSNEQHRAIVLAVLAGQPDDAAAAMEEHIAGSAALLRGFLG